MGASRTGASPPRTPLGRDRRSHRAGSRVPHPHDDGSRDRPPGGGLRARTGARRSPASPARSGLEVDPERAAAQGAGVAAAGVVGAAAALIEMAASVSEDWDE